jgi:hypothetical protein
MGPLLLVWRIARGAARRIRFFVSALVGPPWRALLRVLFGARDRIDDGMGSGATKWQRIWGTAPGDGSEEWPFPHRRIRGLVSAVTVALTHVALTIVNPPTWSSALRAALLVTVYLAVRLVLRSSQPRVPRDAWAWFLADAGRRAGMLWWERGGAALSLVALVVGTTIGDLALVTVGLVMLAGFVPLLAADLDARQSERRAPPLLPSPVEEEPPDGADGVVERVFRFNMPAEVATGDHEVRVWVDEQRYRDAKLANPATAWVDGVPQMQRWVHYQSPEVPHLARDLRVLATGEGYSTFAELQLVLALAQSVEYRSDEEMKGLPDHWQYAIETLYEQTGDCEDTTILSAALLVAMGHRVALLLMPEHAALGVAAPTGVRGHAFIHDGVDYLYAETTAEGAIIGALPDDIQPDDVRVLSV